MTSPNVPADPGELRLRVEDLAERSATSVDTIRFYQKRRLLDPPERAGRLAFYGTAHLDRLARIKDLRRRGLTLALIGRLVRGELDAADAPLAAAVVAAETETTAGDGAEQFLTLDELSAVSGIPAPLLETVVAEGLLVARLHDGEARFTAADTAILRRAMELLGTGLPFDALVSLAREHHLATRSVAERAVALFDEHIREPLRDSSLPDDQRAERLVAAFRVMLPAVTDLVAHHFRRVLLEVATEHLEAVGEDAEIAAAHVEATRRIETVLP